MSDKFLSREMELLGFAKLKDGDFYEAARIFDQCARQKKTQLNLKLLKTRSLLEAERNYRTFKINHG
ncbi:MAG: hypothetical protein SFT81_07575 [Candidatus Caenarcaniphilales bacterium]|nr:hypothetical protein [Candidatus Caenarcaniphilales bacterium]